MSVILAIVRATVSAGWSAHQGDAVGYADLLDLLRVQPVDVLHDPWGGGGGEECMREWERQ